MERQVKIAGHRFVLRNSDVIRAVREIDPEPIRSHYVVVEARRLPPKQIVSALTGLDRADFTTHQAGRIMRQTWRTSGEWRDRLNESV